MIEAEKVRPGRHDWSKDADAKAIDDALVAYLQADPDDEEDAMAGFLLTDGSTIALRFGGGKSRHDDVAQHVLDEVDTHAYPSAGDSRDAIMELSGCIRIFSSCIFHMATFPTEAQVDAIVRHLWENDCKEFVIDFTPPGRLGTYYDGREETTYAFSEANKDSIRKALVSFLEEASARALERRARCDCMVSRLCDCGPGPGLREGD